MTAPPQRIDLCAAAEVVARQRAAGGDGRTWRSRCSMSTASTT